MEILNKIIPSNYSGYYLKEYYTLIGRPIGWENMRPLKRLPFKIVAFIRKEIIAEVRRYDLKDDFTKNQYFLRTVNNNFYELIY